MPNVHNMSLPAAIDVLFFVNFAVVLDFMYFRFRPSKAKSIGNVLMNRQNVANCCLHRGFKKAAEELRMGIPALRQYIDATMPLAPIGNRVQICSVYKVQVLFWGFVFFCCRTSPNEAGGFDASIGSARYKREKKICALLPHFAYSMGHRLLILVYLEETEIH